MRETGASDGFAGAPSMSAAVFMKNAASLFCLSLELSESGLTIRLRCLGQFLLVISQSDDMGLK
jgi:hypothetical protein